ncbi:MAG TPA: TonB-dependent receptor, partial [Ignavibacteriaceae bacterium]|nr:TonB-dependent receptor [Ignavibacteriaceae bacterium]
FICFLAGIVSAQEEKSSVPSVELPDFVITGPDLISVQKAKKAPSEFVPTLSEEFFRPAFSPEELEVKDIPHPVLKDVNLLDSLNYLKGKLDAGIGRYTLPVVKLSYSQPYGNWLFEGFAGAKNVRAYVPNSESYRLDGGLNLNYQVNTNSDFIAGTLFKLQGDYSRNTFKFFKVENSTDKRFLNNGNIGFSFENLLNNSFQVKGELGNIYTLLDKETFRENVFNMGGFLRAKFDGLNLGADLIYRRQYIKNNLMPDGIYNYYSLKPTAGLNISDVVKASFGITYSRAWNANFLSPYAAIAVILNDKLSIFGEFTPHAEYLTGGDMLRQNRYFNQDDFFNIYFKKINALNAVVKYEFERYFEIDAGFDYFLASDFPYFVNSFEPGKFDIETVKARSWTAFSNLLFHAGPYGVFYGRVELNDTRDLERKFIPYYPELKADLSYGYDFKFGLSAHATLFLASKKYTDLENVKYINSYIDLGVKFSYKITPGFYLTLQLSNLFNRDNYIWDGYFDPPLDAIGGISFQW